MRLPIWRFWNTCDERSHLQRGHHIQLFTGTIKPNQIIWQTDGAEVWSVSKHRAVLPVA